MYDNICPVFLCAGYSPFIAELSHSAHGDDILVLDLVAIARDEPAVHIDFCPFDQTLEEENARGSRLSSLTDATVPLISSKAGV